MNYALVPLAASLSVCILLWGGNAFAQLSSQCTTDDTVLDPNTLFAGGATILGLVAFGSLLNLMVSQTTKPVYGEKLVAVMSLGVVFATLGAVLLMLATFFSWSVLDFQIWLIVLGGIVVVYGAVHAWYESIRKWRSEGASTGTERAGDSPSP